MEAIEQLQNSGPLKTYKILKAKTVAEYLADLRLESKFFAILIDGKRANLTDTVSEGSEMLILPKIAGG